MSAAKKSELAVAVAAIRASEGVMKKRTSRSLPNPPPGEPLLIYRLSDCRIMSSATNRIPGLGPMTGFGRVFLAGFSCDLIGRTGSRD